jgi:hypothetical protein
MRRLLAGGVLMLAAAGATGAYAQAANGGARVASFQPQGEVKDVRQVVARFSDAMVSFGDPRTEPPFDVDCAPPGRGRWSDARVWLYDFESDLPAGVVCRFTLRSGLASVAGQRVAPATFTFTTGGPAVRAAWPAEGDEDIDEEQVFLLGLDVAGVEAIDLDSVRRHAYCLVDGIGERIALDVLTGEARRRVLEEQRGRAHNLFQVIGKRGRRVVAGVAAVRDRRIDTLPVVVAKCARRLPPGAVATVVWGDGIRTASGVSTRDVQRLPYRVRREFVAKSTCTRVNADAGCVPVLPIRLEFSAPVARDAAARIELVAADGRVVRPQVPERERTVEAVEFHGPFPAQTTARLVLPAKLVDDGGRALANAASFPLAIRIDDDPPLVKFGASFGILEANADPALPVTVRNVEPQLAGVAVGPPAAGGGPGGGADARVAGSGASLRIDTDDDAVLAQWLRRLLVGPPVGYPGRNRREIRPGELPLLSAQESARASPLVLPLPEAGKPMQVIGIPLAARGLHVVEFASRRLGESLHGGAVAGPYYTYAGALVTNLSVHFKHGRESSLAWVTQLDDARPVAGAAVRVSDCTGRPVWSGTTDANGIARIDAELPKVHRWEACRHAPSAYLVTARKDGDLALMLTSWNEGIRPWNFNLAYAGGRSGADAALSAHTVTDRPLFRAGETVSMKHFVRRRAGTGFALPDEAVLPRAVQVEHVGSGQRFEVPVRFAAGVAQTSWPIPKEAKTGDYQVSLLVGGRPLRSGSFRVEQFRVPLMRAVLKPPAAPVIRPATGDMQVDVDAQLSYLAGGPAARAPVKFRTRLVPHAFVFRDYDDFGFGGAVPKEGIDTGLPDWMFDPDADAETPAAGGGGPRGASTATRDVALDAAGGARVTFDRLPRVETPQALEVEMEYADPNGQVLTAATRALLLPSSLVLGMKVEGFFATRERLAFKVLALDAAGRPQAGRVLRVDAYERKRYAYRKRQLGGFYAYEQSTETRKLSRTVCKGRTDERGLLACDGAAPAAGELVLVARGADDAGNEAVSVRELYVAGGDDHWFEAGASDRIDLLPDKRAYEAGERARFEVRMPFRAATALVAVEREGVLSTQVVHLDAKSPFVEVPMLDHYGPNVVVSVLAVRGRVDPEQPGPFAWLKRLVWRVRVALGVADAMPKEVDTRPTALVDLTRPAYRLGMAQVRVGWRPYELKVKVQTDKAVYRVRDRAVVDIAVTDAAGRPAADAEVALAAVDEGLLALMPNRSWDLLAAMMQRRATEVETSTAQGQVIGKRHFGRKAVAPGGGGGSASARELFDTLLAWQGAVKLDAAGRARLEVPLSDALTSFRFEAIAHAGAARFGSGGASARTTQEVMLFAGLPPLVREGDRFDAMFTVRNGGERALVLEVGGDYGDDRESGRALAPQRIELAAGAAQTVSFAAAAPVGARRLDWRVSARELPPASGAPATPPASDALKVTQTVSAAYPVRVYQQTLLQLEPGRPESFPVELPKGALAGRGGVEVRLARSLGGDVESIREWMRAYPFTCLEQRVSRAVALEDAALWSSVMNALPAYLDRDGLARYFPSPLLDGDDTLTAYLLAIAHEAKLEIPEDARRRMLAGLSDFVAGRIHRYGALPTADLAFRRIAALDAMARFGFAQPQMLEPLIAAGSTSPSLMPSSAVIDWISLLSRLPGAPRRDERLAEAREVLRSRLMYSGTTLAFSTEKADYLWWLMVSPDRNAVRTLLMAVDDSAAGAGGWRDDVGRLARGALGRQAAGRWSTTTANAWGVLALRRFQARYEREPVAGVTAVAVGDAARTLDWKDSRSRATNDPVAGTPIGSGPETLFAWPQASAPLTLAHQGSGRPWAFVASRAALPLDRPLAAGYSIRRSVAPVEQRRPGEWARGDVLRVTLEVDALADMTWVAVADPVPAGATILGSGLGGDSSQLASGQRREGLAWPAFEERTFEGLRAYYRYVPKGKFTLQYTMRLNNAGTFEMPATRVEAMYAPEVFGELPVAKFEVKP